jgi:2-dehydro-3-deoxyglucarate aldolase/4-hydroxy-2-oxoheptanedioate aldolase
MNVTAIAALRRKLAADVPAHGLWVTLEAPAVSEMAAALGLDWIVIDAEHGALDWRDIAAHLRAVVRSGTAALVRLEENDRGLIKRALDLGADGVVLPRIETAHELARAVAAANYPPEGCRGLGAERATAWGRAAAQHTAEANAHVLVAPIVETVAGGRNLGELLAVPGADLFQLGPADYSADAGFRGQWEGPGVAEALLAIKDAVRAAGRSCGILARDAADLALRTEQGFRFLGLGMDAGLLLRGIEEMLRSLGRVPAVAADLRPIGSDADTARP